MITSIGRLLGILAVLLLGTLFGASIYDAVVFGPNLQAGGPQGLDHGRHFMSAATPANLFRVLSPATQLVLLAAAVTNWRQPTARWLLLAGLVSIVTCDAITFLYAYPRLRILFGNPLSTSAAELASAADEWVVCNYIRVLLVLVAWSFALYAAHLVSRKPSG